MLSQKNPQVLCSAAISTEGLDVALRENERRKKAPDLENDGDESNGGDLGEKRVRVARVVNVKTGAP